jgi:acetolactate synthase-1/2/3 large subunit
VFGIPGIQLDPLFDALHGCRDRIRTVHTRHEQGAAFMAMGYAQATGRPGVFIAVPGPGMLNAMDCGCCRTTGAVYYRSDPVLPDR